MENNELYHYGVPGMRWGVRKAKLQAKADAYRKAASNTKSRERQGKYLDKADKFEQKSAALDTIKGKIMYTAKKGAAITAGILAGQKILARAIKVGDRHGEQRVKDLFKKRTGEDMDFLDFRLGFNKEHGYKTTQKLIWSLD